MSWWTEPIIVIPIDTLWDTAFWSWIGTKTVAASYIQYCYQGCKTLTDHNEEDNYYCVRDRYSEYYVEKPESWRGRRDTWLWLKNFLIYPEMYALMLPVFVAVNLVIQQWDWTDLLPKKVQEYQRMKTRAKLRRPEMFVPKSQVTEGENS